MTPGGPSSSRNNNDMIFGKHDRILRNRFGRLYHHALPRLRPKQMNILKEAGVILDDDVWNFERHEDDVIRRNWDKFRTVYRIEHGILEFVGTGKVVKEIKNHKKLQELIWPCLCAGLNNRSAATVHKRILYIFDANFDENEEYDMEELKKSLKFAENAVEVAERLKIPLSFVNLHMARDRAPENFDNYTTHDYFRILKCLADSVKKNEKNGKFYVTSFDWRVFEQRWTENCTSPAPEGVWVMERFRSQFWVSETRFFNHIEPKIDLKTRITMVHESMSRFYASTDKRALVSTMPRIRHQTMFTVILEHFTKLEGSWTPPPALLKYLNEVKVENVEKRVEKIKNERKRRSESPKFRITAKRVLEKKKAPKSLLFEAADDQIEISAIEPDEVTSVEISDLTTDLSIRKDETILARGPPLFKKPSPKKDTFVPDESIDLWSQLIEK